MIQLDPSGAEPQAILAAADLSGARVLEIGAGQGALTRELAHRVKYVVAVEKDPRLAEVLQATLGKEKTSNIQIIRGDILKLTPGSLHLPPEYKIVSNIPYYLTARLLRQFLSSRHQIGRAHV